MRKGAGNASAEAPSEPETRLDQRGDRPSSAL